MMPIDFLAILRKALWETMYFYSAPATAGMRVLMPGTGKRHCTLTLERSGLAPLDDTQGTWVPLSIIFSRKVDGDVS